MGRAEGLRVAGGVGGRWRADRAARLPSFSLGAKFPVRSISGTPGSDHMLWGESFPAGPTPGPLSWKSSSCGRCSHFRDCLPNAWATARSHSPHPSQAHLAGTGAEHPHSAHCSQKGTSPLHQVRYCCSGQILVCGSLR